MPNKPSAKKELRKRRGRTARNIEKKKKVKELHKATLRALQSKPDDAFVFFRQTVKALDKAAKSRTIHPNKAARLKSRLQRKLNTASHKATPSPSA